MKIANYVLMVFFVAASLVAMKFGFDAYHHTTVYGVPTDKVVTYKSTIPQKPAPIPRHKPDTSLDSRGIFIEDIDLLAEAIEYTNALKPWGMK